jgi:hypothetical protein
LGATASQSPVAEELRTKSSAYQVNRNYRKIIPDLEALEILMSDARLTFAHGLLEVLDSTASPSIVWFKSLPTDCVKRWALYLLVVEDPGCDRLTYIGSGTSGNEGIKWRWRCYDTRTRLPNGLKKALDVSNKEVLAQLQAQNKALLPKN